VPTIVAMSPNRRASNGASDTETACTTEAVKHSQPSAATLTPNREAPGNWAFLDARHRAHARVEDRIRTGKDTGLGRFPSRSSAINAAWLTAVTLAVDLLA
jgi:hypothetical protein